MDSLSSFHRMVDVKRFFFKVTQGYLEFTASVHDFSQKLDCYSPEQILSECSTIQNKREELSVLDQQLIEIVELAHREIRHENFIDEYRTAFNEAILACDELHTNLVLTKVELLSALPVTEPN